MKDTTMAIEYLSVGKVAKRCGVKVSTLHFYEKKGLIVSERNSGNQRIYARETIRRVALIKAAQQLGISLDEIQNALEVLPKHKAPSQAQWSKMAKNWRLELQKRIAKLEILQDYLDGCIGCGCLSMKQCPIYNPEDKLADQGAGAIIINRAGE